MTPFVYGLYNLVPDRTCGPHFYPAQNGSKTYIKMRSILLLSILGPRNDVPNRT